MALCHVLGVILVFQVGRSCGWFEQKLNHFDSTSGTFQQQYWQTWFGRSGLNGGMNVTGVAFLMISGESADTSPLEGAWMEYAAKISGMGVDVVCFELEHRYYGASLPTSGFEYLSSDQALEDIRYFITSMSSVNQFQNYKWVVFGGSYAGALAAWARQQYPDLIHAAVASSAPLEAKADLDEYLEVIRQSLSLVDPSCPPLVTKLARALPSLISDVEYLVQYGFQENACQLVSCLENTGDYQSCHQQWYHFHIVSNPWRNAELFTSNSFIKRGFHGSAWQYQQCTEFGWFPTSGKDSSLFGSIYPLSSFIYYSCQNDYAPLINGISHINSIHHGKKFATDRVLFLHGSLDPYIIAGITSTTPRTPVHVVPGGSHCLDMYLIDDITRRYKHDALVESVQYAQELTLTHLVEWLNE